MIPALLMVMGASAGSMPPVDGALLPQGKACYTIAASDAGGVARGHVLRRVERIGGDRLRMTITSRIGDGPLLTSRIDVVFANLRPIRTIEKTDGRVGLSVRYGDSLVTGTIVGENGRRKTTEEALPGPVWDEETLEFVASALPLAEGAHFELPLFHFGRGPKVTQIDVRRSVSVDDIALGPTPAWEVEAGTRSGMKITFLIGRADRRLLAVDEIAAYALFLAGETAGGVTGQAVVIDGGYVAQ